MTRRIIFRSGWLLGLFGIVIIGLVGLVFKTTEDAIEESEYQALLVALNSVVPPERYNNDMASESRPLAAHPELGLRKPGLLYQARQDGKLYAVAFPISAPDGYSGPINMLIAVDTSGTLLGIRVVSHTETPGLGDRIESRRSDWNEQFRGKSLENPEEKYWKVKKDGGIFDQFTGATITPRIIVKAIHKALVFIKAQPEIFFDE